MQTFLHLCVRDTREKRRREENVKDRSGTERKGCGGDGVAVARTVFPPCGSTVNCSCINA